MSGINDEDILPSRDSLHADPHAEPRLENFWPPSGGYNYAPLKGANLA
jgi:hypothetical protein